VKLDTLLQGYRLDTNQGAVAFCAVNMLEGVDGHGTLRRIVIDTGHTGRRPALRSELAKRGLDGSDIDIVVCTHAHWDHIENLDQRSFYPEWRSSTRRAIPPAASP
jgi:glyoxylase-like metal-dependent hydrolase (beta-lactamase superfamily II)